MILTQNGRIGNRSHIYIYVSIYRSVPKDDVPADNNGTSCPPTAIPLPVDLLKLEGHFNKKCPVHNDDRKFRSELNRLRKYLADCRVNDEGDGVTLNSDGKLEEVEKSVEKGNDIRADQSRFVFKS